MAEGSTSTGKCMCGAMLCMVRSSMLLVLILGLAGCAGTQTFAESCARPTEQSALVTEQYNRSACTERAVGYERVAALGAVGQTGSQTRRVGVPQGFLVAMIVLIVLVSLL